MKIDYQITNFHKPTSSIQVRYFSDDLPSGVTFSLTLPVVDGKLPQGHALEDFVLQHVPRDVFERAAVMRNAEGSAQLDAMPSPTQQTSVNALVNAMVVCEGSERIFMMRPLVQMHSFGIPLDII